MTRRASTTKSRPPREPWKKWPQTTDLVVWMRTLLALTDHMDRLKDRTETTVSVAIDLLASLGQPAEALQWIERLDKTVPANDGHHHSQFVLQGAEIAFDAGMLDVMERYLQRLLDMQPLFPRKCDRGYAEKAVRDFRTDHGLLNPRDAVDDKQRAKASFNALVRSARLALDKGDKQQASKNLVDALPIIEQLETWRHKYARRDLADGFTRAGDKKNLSRVMELDDNAGKNERFLATDLLKIGQRGRAIARFQQQAKEALAELETERLNAHFPAMQLEHAIIGLADAGEMKLARDWLARALQEGAGWNINRMDAFSSAVFQSMAKAVARVEGNDAAFAVLDIAEDRATKANPSGWRTAALRSVASMRMELGSTDKAEAAARAVRSPRERRKLLVSHFAKCQDWANLHQTLDAAKTPLEAADLIYDLKFVWQSKP